MKDIQATAYTITGQGLCSVAATFLDPFYIFKGKLRAAATRSKFHDSFDLRWIADRFLQIIQVRKGELNLEYIGLAIKRYPELELLFIRLDINITRAKDAASNLDSNNLSILASGYMQRGLLG